MKNITQKDIVRGLRAVGLELGDDIIVHSSLSSFGPIAGGPDTLINALLEAVGAEGTVISPAFGSTDNYFDPKKSETNLGLTPQVFWKRKDAVRSLHPLASIAAIGKKASWYIKGHEQAVLAHGKDSPYFRLYEAGGKVLLLGVDQDRNTFLHVAEELLRLPYLSPRKASYIGRGRKRVTKTYQYFPGPHRNFIGLQNWLEENSLTRKTTIGSCVAQLMPCKPLLDALIQRLGREPSLFISTNPNLPDGIQQNADVFRALLRKEKFLLAADSQSAGKYLEESIDNLKRFGIDNIVLSYINSVPWHKLAPDKRRWYLRGLRNSKIKIAGLKLPILVPEEAVRLAKEAKTDKIIVPSTVSTASVTAATHTDLNIFIENVQIPSGDFVHQIKRYAGSATCLKAAFNPLEFVRVAEHPFLDVYTKTAIKRYVGLIFVNDGLATGQQTLIEQGLCEIKELVSIFRSRSFRGMLVLQSPSPADFGKNAAKFLGMLKELGKPI